jgi:hypothetical protein
MLLISSPMMRAFVRERVCRLCRGEELEACSRVELGFLRCDGRWKPHGCAGHGAAYDVRTFSWEPRGCAVLEEAYDVRTFRNER